MSNVLVNEDTRTIYLYDRIDYESISSVIFNILNFINSDNENEEQIIKYKREPIKLYISTDGGDTDAMWGLVDVITNSKTPIYTYCLGACQSCGFVIFIAGHKRFITKHSKLMIHSMGITTIEGKDIGWLKDFVNNMEDANEGLFDFIINNTKISKEMLIDMRNYHKDWYIYGEQAIKLGCADVII